jgi:polygalacturonase
MNILACAVLSAQLTAPRGAVAPDTARIQHALDLCSPGHALILKIDGPRTVFESAPLILPRGVTLFVDRGVTLFASSNPRDYDLAPNSCGAAPSSQAAVCKPFLFSYQAAFSGVAGTGTIDGHGEGWWGHTATAPDLVSSYESQGFEVNGVTLRNAAGVHAAIYKTSGFASTGLRIYEVGERVGYPNVEHFSRVFKKHTGKSPSAWPREGEGAPG